MDQGMFQDWLDQLGQTFFDDDFAAYADQIELPLAITTLSKSTLVTDQAQLKIGFDAWRDMMVSQNVTDMVRLARSVSIIGDGLVTAQYRTLLLNNALEVVPPFESTMTLRRCDDGWKSTAVASGMSNISFPITVPRVPVEH